MDSMMKEPFPMELVGDFWAADPIFKGCYGDSLLYSDTELCWLRQWEIHLPVYQGEIPMPLAPSYLQAREPEVSKQSPPRAAAPDTPAESPKVKHSGGKSGPHRSLGHSSQHLNSKVPRLYFSQETLQLQKANLEQPGESPKARSSHKHGHSPSLAAKSVGCKWKDVCTEDSHILNTTLPISSSMFDDLRSD